MTPWWELRSGDEYTVGVDQAAGPDGSVCVLHEGERLFVFEGGYGEPDGPNVTEADLRLVARFMGEQTRTERTFLEVVESASDALICGDLPRPPANDTHRALERALALIAPPKSTPAGADTPAG